VAFCTFGFLGSNFSTGITSQYGALVNGICNTFRKAVTIALSFVLFPERNQLTLSKVYGVVVFFSGLLIRIFFKSHQQHRNNTMTHQSANNGIAIMKNSGKFVEERDDLESLIGGGKDDQEDDEEQGVMSLTLNHATEEVNSKRRSFISNTTLTLDRSDNRKDNNNKFGLILDDGDESTSNVDDRSSMAGGDGGSFVSTSEQGSDKFRLVEDMENNQDMENLDENEVMHSFSYYAAAATRYDAQDSNQQSDPQHQQHRLLPSSPSKQPQQQLVALTKSPNNKSVKQQNAFNGNMMVMEKTGNNNNHSTDLSSFSSRSNSGNHPCLASTNHISGGQQGKVNQNNNNVSSKIVSRSSSSVLGSGRKDVHIV
jgi:hypothetical protein